MSDEETPPPNPSSTPHIGRERLILIGALVFLFFSLGLTFFFTPNLSTPPIPPTSTSGGLEPSSVALITPTDPGMAGLTPTSTDLVYPSPVNPSPVNPSPVNPSATVSAYPGLDATTNAALATSNALESPTSSTSAYPIVEPEGTPPTQPTLRPSPTVLPVPTQAPAPTRVVQPTSPPLPTNPPTPTHSVVAADAPANTPIPADPKEPPPTRTPTSVLPTAIPADVVRGDVHWQTGQSPITLRRDVQIPPGAELVIEPGVEVRLDPGVSIYVDGGRLLVMGTAQQPVRFVGTTRARWSGIFGRPGSYLVMEYTQISGGGAGGTLMAVESGSLTLRNTRITENGGGVLVNDSQLEIKDSEIAGNDVPFGAALDASYSLGTNVTLHRNRIAGNRLSDGAPMVRIANQSTFSALLLDLAGNLVRGGTPNLQLLTNGPIQGNVTCNTLIGDGLGFGLRTQTIQVAPNGVPTFGQLNVINNLLDEHVPPIEPVYLKYGLGRGATSEVLLDMRNNWWGDSSGPYEPDANPEGRGDSVGSNILFAPWLTEAPACAPPH
ncbi:right-handed parallel beta-helix repeat-containing protein [Candidatus Oscillochloris fontis]|uniref:right-handed parallel beta-helix repeat-containing protein n=1 Tax=Candidatus Oscillochloris fontis TaxID=2496868 RepID=UPI00101C52F5|nr:right-handed parallel beta-helix repeat-containing protein [Candidatus Oscillochloris fontis]